MPALPRITDNRSLPSSTNRDTMTTAPTFPASLPPPALEHLCDLLVSVAPAIVIGDTPSGTRRVIPITGGTVRGRINGRVLNAGADFQLVHGAGTEAHLDARYVIEADDRALIWVHNTALRVASPENVRKLMAREPVNPAEVYFRCQPRLEAAAPQWQCLNHSQFIGSVRRADGGVFLSFYSVL